jgi:hypothetical protein
VDALADRAHRDRAGQLIGWFPHLDSAVSTDRHAGRGNANSILAPYDLENTERPGSEDRNRAV